MGSPGAGHPRNTDEMKYAVPHETPAHPAASSLPTSRSALSATAQLEPWHPARMAAVGQTEGRPAERTLFGHPVGLANLFGVELWERFSFYGMLTILGYYLYYSVTEGGLELPKSTATGIVGAYGGRCTSRPCSAAGSPIGFSAWNGRCSTAAWW
jgi:hypothetical protein